METDYALSSIGHIAKADFLQHIRSHYFLVALGVCVVIIYSFVPPLDAGYTMVSLGNYRGFYNSAWIGSMVAMCVPFFTLIGFYVVNNAVKRDTDSGVGQIIATTRISKIQYLFGKLLSNFAVLLLILSVIAMMTIVMFLVRGETSHLELDKLLLPLLILTVPAMFILAALALFFDALSGISRGFVNIAYFFLWIFMVSGSLWSPATDVFAVNTCMLDMKDSISAMHPDWNGRYGTGILIINSIETCKVFTWEGMTWTPMIFLQRMFWMLAALGLVMLASLRFNRFDNSNFKVRKQGTSWLRRKQIPLTDSKTNTLRMKYHDLPQGEARFSYISLVRAELLLMLRGNTTLWLVLTAGMFVASVFAPIGFSYKVSLPLLWFFQVLILSKLGSREIISRCSEYIFSAPYPLKRQLPAIFSAALLVLLLLALPVLIRLFLSGNFYGLYAIPVGAMFIVAFALTSGILTGGSKLFEVIFTVMVYGLLNKVPFFDFIGAIEESQSLGVAHYLMAATLVLVFLAFSGRRWQISG